MGSKADCSNSITTKGATKIHIKDALLKPLQNHIETGSPSLSSGSRGKEKSEFKTEKEII